MFLINRFVTIFLKNFEYKFHHWVRKKCIRVIHAVGFYCIPTRREEEEQDSSMMLPSYVFQRAIPRLKICY